MGLMSARRGAMLAGASAIAIFTVGGAFAQEADTTTDPNERLTVLQRIIIGAGAEKVAIDTPQAVTVVNQEEIDQEQATTVGELLDSVPGVNVSGSSSVLGQSFNIRGIGAPESAGQEGRLIINVDGVNKFYEQYRMGGFFSEPELYKKVEVLRGPASSTLYGPGALGGVINFVTKDASDFLAEGQNGILRLKGGYNSNTDGWMKSATLAQRVDDIEFLFNYNYRTSDTGVDGNGDDIANTEHETWSGLAKATINMADEAKLRVSYQQWVSDEEDQEYSQTDDFNFGTVDREVIDRTAIVAYENPFLDNDLLDLKVQASWSDTTNRQRDASGITFFGRPLNCATSALFCDTDYSYETYQLEIQNTSTFRGADWENFLTYGYQYTEQSRGAEVLNGPFTNLSFHPEGTDTRHGVFVQNEFVWNEQLTIIPGVRFDKRTLESGGSTGLDLDTDDTAVSPKIAAHYRFNDTLAVFGSFAHTERFPVIDEVFSIRTSRGVAYDPSLDLKKEISDNWEAGFSLSFYGLAQSGDSLQIKTTGFHNTIEDLIATNQAAPGPGVPGYINIDNAEIYGVEIEAAYDSEFVFASLGYENITGRNTDTNAHLTSVAPETLNVKLGGRLPDHGLEFGWKGKFAADPADKCRVSDESVSGCDGGGSRRHSEAFNVHDLFLTWKPVDNQWEGWELQAGVDNIFDTQYKEFLVNNNAKGRTFKVSLTKQLGW